MATQVIWSRVAVADLDDIERYISRDSERYAGIVVEKILAAGQVLEMFPLMGRRVPELKDDRFRELIIYQYRLIYFVETDRVEIVTVFHGARRLPSDIGTRRGQP